MLKEGEVICDKCNGTGVWKKVHPCYKCLGKGKLDWVTNVMGGRRKPLVAHWGTSSASSLSDSNKINDKFIKEMAREMVKKIDEEILQSLSDPTSLKNYARRIKYDN
jgi:RecJ-like exonuclease